ncbi:MAG TPA: hypothetical protein VF648_21385 [Pyrinomonadaceae bacterium]
MRAAGVEACRSFFTRHRSNWRSRAKKRFMMLPTGFFDGSYQKPERVHDYREKPCRKRVLSLV